MNVREPAVDRPDDEDLLTFEQAAEMALMTPEGFRYLVYHSGENVQPQPPEGFRLGKKRVFRRREIREWIKAVEASQKGRPRRRASGGTAA